jgi:hypothetical protein
MLCIEKCTRSGTLIEKLEGKTRTHVNKMIDNIRCLADLLHKVITSIVTSNNE